MMSDNTIGEDDNDDQPSTQDRIPETIQPGRLAFTFWSVDGSGGEVGTDVILHWDGEHDVEWYEDISPETDGLSVMSSAPFGGIARWPNGRDVDVSYGSDDFDMEGKAVLEDAAPISESGDKRDVASWTDFARALQGLVDGLIN